MAFNNYLTCYDASCAKNTTPLEFSEAMLFWKFEHIQTYLQILSECVWINNKRPYYQIYAPMADALSKVPLDVPSKYFELPLPEFEIRLPEPHWNGIRTMLVTKVNEGKGIYIWADLGERTTFNGIEVPVYAYSSFPLSPDKTVAECLVHTPDVLTEDEQTKMQTCIRLALATSLLGLDSPLVSPEVLTRDKIKAKAADPNRLALLVARAARYGKIGWTIGDEKMTVSPHYRTGHFAFRWTGKGRTTKRLVWIDATMVHRDKITHVPTGYKAT